MIAILDTPGKPTPDGGRRPCPRSGSTFRDCKKAGESIPDPKGREPRTPTDVFPANQVVSGVRRKGPSSPSWTPQARQADAVMVGEGHAPVVAVLRDAADLGVACVEYAGA
jgi:hypothetical protein